MKKIAKGRQGDWFATLRNTGELLPCVFREFWIGKTGYHDPHVYDLSNSQDRQYVEAIQNTKRVLLTTNLGADGTRKRGAYIDECEVADVICDDNGLRFKFVRRKHRES